MSVRQTFFTLFFLLVWSECSQASTVLDVPFLEKAKGVDLVLRARVLGVEYRQTTRTMRIDEEVLTSPELDFTFYRLKVLDVVAGDLNDSEVELFAFGGPTDDSSFIVMDGVTLFLGVGEELVFFLSKDEFGLGYYSYHGTQGVFRQYKKNNETHLLSVDSAPTLTLSDFMSHPPEHRKMADEALSEAFEANLADGTLDELRRNLAK